MEARHKSEQLWKACVIVVHAATAGDCTADRLSLLASIAAVLRRERRPERSERLHREVAASKERQKPLVRQGDTNSFGCMPPRSPLRCNRRVGLAGTPSPRASILAPAQSPLSDNLGSNRGHDRASCWESELPARLSRGRRSSIQRNMEVRRSQYRQPPKSSRRPGATERLRQAHMFPCQGID